MKLWVKTSLIAITVCAVAMGICAMAILSYTAQNEVDKAIQTALNEHYLFSTALVSSVESQREPGLSDVTNRSVAQYYFKNVANSYESQNVCFSLVQDGSYLYNRSPFDPLSLLQRPQDSARQYAIMQVGSAKVLIVAGRIELLGQTFDVYDTQDITNMYLEMQSLTRRVTWALLSCTAVLSSMLLMMNRFALRPLGKLADAAGDMAEGNYSQRMDAVSADEVGQLSLSFNRMAEAVQAHILQLEDTARQRKLLLSSLTHELKTPMTAIIGYSDCMLRFKLNSEQQQRAVRQIYDQCRHMENLSQKLMRLITLDAGESIQAVPVLMEQLVCDVQETMAATLSQRRQTLEVDNRLDTLTADYDLMLSLLGNLIDNASKASPEDSVIYLRAYGGRGGMVLEVSDSGTGIPAGEIEHITEPFYRVEPSRSRQYGGLGLGLSLCRMIAQKHNAQLQFENNAEGGACVRVVFAQNEGGAVA